MSIKSNFFVAVIFIVACVLDADAQKTRHVIPNRNLCPDNGMSEQ
jgi:hypothetical protein